MSKSLKNIPLQLKNIELDYIKVSRIHYAIFLFIICGILGFLAIKENQGYLFTGIFLVVLCLFIFALIYFPKKNYLNTKYGLIDDVFYVQQGIWFKKRAAVAQNRIQHTDVSQGPIARRYNLATLTMHTAGMREADIAVPGLKYADAVAMRDHLIHLNKMQGSSEASAGDMKEIVKVTLNLLPDENCVATSVLALRAEEE